MWCLYNNFSIILVILLQFRIVDAIQECCHCNDSMVAITSVDLINDLLNSVELLVKGHGFAAAELHDRPSGSQPDSPERNVDPPTNDGGSSDCSDMHYVDAVERQDALSDTSLDAADNATSGVTTSSVTAADDCNVDRLNVAVNECLDETEEKFQRKNWTSSSEFDAKERECARTYIQSLIEFLPSLISCTRTTEADELIHEHSSKFCTGMICTF